MIFFDLDETLFDFKSAEYSAVIAFYRQFQESSKCNALDFYYLWCSIGKKHFDRFLLGELNFEQQKIVRMIDLYQSFGIKIDEKRAMDYFQVYLNYFEENWITFNDVIPCLNNLKEYRLGVITNGDSSQQRQKLEKIGILYNFQFVIASGDIGISKPNAEIFLHACKVVQEKPEDCFYIGDNLKTDILPCEKTGMKGIWLNRNGDNSNSHIRTINSLKDLREQLF
ncbi:putative hydrolase of the HAD superfamily [Paenibacillus sp. DS2015]|uniref:HAD family hydrolase n=1 Tax=Paenibacillus sp. DS2015 TaxID=3373917 RepID=UPI003D1B5D61